MNPKLPGPATSPAAVWRASAVGPRLRDFIRIATQVLRDRAPARSRRNGTLAGGPIVARHYAWFSPLLGVNTPLISW